MIHSLVELLDEQVPVLALAIHNGHEMHPALLPDCGVAEADRLREEDPYTDVFAGFFQNSVVVYTSRFTVDLNRPREKCVYLNPEDCWGLPARLKPVGTELLAELYADYDGWYSLLTYSINRLLEQHPFVLVLDLHSYNHRRGGPAANPDPQAANPDIILGRNNLPLALYPWVEQLRTQLDGQNICGLQLDCRADVKFPGGWASRWINHTFGGKAACLAVEFKKIWMDEWTGQVDKNLQLALGEAFAQAVESTRANISG